MKTNWSKMLNVETVQVVREFARNNLAKNTALNLLAFKDGCGEFRNLVRTVGADKARKLARKALSRRGL